MEGMSKENALLYYHLRRSDLTLTLCKYYLTYNIAEWFLDNREFRNLAINYSAHAKITYKYLYLGNHYKNRYSNKQFVYCI